MKRQSLLKTMLLLCALIVGSGSNAWAAPITTGSLTWPTPQLSENFNNVSTISNTAAINGSTNAYGIFNKMYNNNTKNTYAIASNATFDSKVLSLTLGSGSPLIASVTGQTFATKGAFSFKVLKTSKCYVGLYASATDNNATSKSLTSVYIQNNNGAVSIANYNSSGSGSTTWQSVGTYTTNVIEICVVYNNTNSADTYGGSISLAAKTAHVFVNGTCIMNGDAPKAFTIPGFNLTSFRVAPIATSGNNAIVDDFNIYNSLPTEGGGDPVAATGVSLNKSTTSLTVGDTEKLIATVAPNNATDKVVSWNSNNTSVASVDSEGNVTAAALGTARITVTTHDGSFTDYCDVTVVPVAATLDFSSNTGWGFPTAKTVGPNSYTNGYTVTLQGSTGQGYYFDTDNLLLGKNGATLTLPAFPFKVSKIKVYGTSGASASVTFNIFVGDDAVSTSATSSKVDHEFEIDAEKQDAGTVYVIKVTNDNNMRISKIKIFGYTSVTIASACTDGKGKYYGTYSNSYAFRVPADLEVSEISVISGELLVDNYSTGDIVPANTGVMIASTSPGAHTINIATGGTSVLDNDNMLKPSGDSGIDAAGMSAAAPSCKYYRLTMHNGTQIGYYWGAASGAAFALAANKAYLAVPVDAARSGFNLFGDDDTTGIEAVDINTESANVAREYYNLNGQRVANPSKGLYIVNGKKVIIK